MAMLLEHHKQLERLLTRLEAFCQSTLLPSLLSLKAPRSTGADGCGRTPCAPQKGARRKASQGTLPYPSPLQAEEEGQAVEDGTQR